jgi:hypothetical protein
MSFKVECTGVPNTGEYVSNAIRLATEEEAKRYGRELSCRWMAMGEWRVAESSDPVTNRADHLGILRKLEEVSDDTPA